MGQARRTHSGQGAAQVLYALAAILAMTLTATACAGTGTPVDVSAQSASASEERTTTVAPAIPGATVSTWAGPVTTRARQTTTTPPPQGTVETTQPGGGETVTTQTVTTTPPRQPRKIAYPKGGAKGTVVPPNDDAFEMFTTQTCDEPACGDPGMGTLGPPAAAHDLPLPTAANACLSHWHAAVADFNNLAPFVGEFADAAADNPLPCPSDATGGQIGCPRCEKLVLAWLTEVVAAYRSDPDLPPVLTGTATAAPC